MLRYFVWYNTGDLQVVAVEDSSDLDEHIEMDESAGENSDNDLFMSPPPLALSQNDVSNWESNHTTTSQPGTVIWFCFGVCLFGNLFSHIFTEIKI